MKKEKNIDELLNAFVDGELSRRELVEVKRLISHDPQIEQKLNELKKSKILIGSLPRSEAPQEMLQGIKNTIERKSLLEEQATLFSEKQGAKHLLLRKVLTAAAMIALMAGLTAVIYNIAAPLQNSEQMVRKDWGPVDEVTKPAGTITQKNKIDKKTSADYFPFDARLVLKTDNLVAVDAFINRTVTNNGLLENTRFNSDKDKRYCEIKCTTDSLGPLVEDLKNVWRQCSSASLLLETGRFAKNIKIDKINPDQIMQIADVLDSKKRLNLARDFAALNNLYKQMPGRTVASVLTEQKQSGITIPKPVLTSSKKEPAEKINSEVNQKDIYFTIIIEPGD